MNRKRLELPSFRRHFVELDQVVPPAETETSRPEEIFFIAIIHRHGACSLVGEHKFGYKLLPLPAAGNVAGVGYGGFFNWCRHFQIYKNLCALWANLLSSVVKFNHREHREGTKSTECKLFVSLCVSL